MTIKNMVKSNYRTFTIYKVIVLVIDTAIHKYKYITHIQICHRSFDVSNLFYRMSAVYVQCGGLMSVYRSNSRNTTNSWDYFHAPVK